MARINADAYRHFGRLGGGTVMGSERPQKVIVIEGDVYLPTA